MLKVKVIIFFMATIELFKAVETLDGEDVSISHLLVALYAMCVSMDAVVNLLLG